MGSFSLTHWIIVLVVVILIFGTKKLGNIGEDLGNAIKGFKKGMKDEDKPVGQLGDESRNETNSESKERDRDAH